MGKMCSMCYKVTSKVLLLFLLIIVLVCLTQKCYAHDDGKMGRCNSQGH